MFGKESPLNRYFLELPYNNFLLYCWDYNDINSFLRQNCTNTKRDETRCVRENCNKNYKRRYNSCKYFKKIVTPGKSRQRPKKFDLDGFDLCAIRQKIHSFYVVHKELPTLAKLRAALKEDINFQGSISTLHRILNRIGFKYKRCQSRRKLVMERHGITAWHARYLNKLRLNK